MNKEELISKLKECAANDDTECAHIDADNALLEYINDTEITEAFRNVGRWYA
jgi:hypothetical protein